MPLVKKQLKSNSIQKSVDEASEESFPASDAPAWTVAKKFHRRKNPSVVLLKDNVSIEWKRKGASFDYEKYNRDAKLNFGGGKSIVISNPPQYFGDTKYPNSEELFIGALSSCYMQTFLAVASKQGYAIKSYKDDVEAQLGIDQFGKMGITQANLNIKIKFEGIQPSSGALQKLQQMAHDHCFIANSVCSKINISIKLIK